jgi:hypothetical protein
VKRIGILMPREILHRPALHESIPEAAETGNPASCDTWLLALWSRSTLEPNVKSLQPRFNGGRDLAVFEVGLKTQRSTHPSALTTRVAPG